MHRSSRNGHTTENAPEIWDLSALSQAGSPRSLRVLIVSDRIYPYFKGGAEKRYWEIARDFVQRGHQVRFLTGQWPGMARYETRDGIQLQGVYKVGKFYVNGRKSITESIVYALALLPALMTAHYDIIECEQFPLLSMFSAKLASIVRGKPLVATWHEVWDTKAWVAYLGAKGIIGALIERLCTRLPHRILSVSPTTTHGLEHVHRTDHSRIATVVNGIDCDLADSVEPQTQSTDIVYVGRLLEHKHVDVLLSIAWRPGRQSSRQKLAGASRPRYAPGSAQAVQGRASTGVS